MKAMGETEEARVEECGRERKGSRKGGCEGAAGRGFQFLSSSRV